MDQMSLQARYDELKAEAELLAGDLLDIPRRVVILLNLYLDSGGNHAFSQIAAHGALWALGYFETAGSLGRLIGQRYFYNSKEREFRMGILNEFAENFRIVNRQVCIDTYTNYQFTKEHGQHPNAHTILPASLLDALNRVHHARENQRAMTEVEKRQVFEQSFLCEQEVTVAPGVEIAIATFECRVMKFLCMHPVVRFAYFPRWKYLFFRNFASKAERIERGLLAYEYAVKAGWANVHDSLKKYGQLPPEFLDAPQVRFADLRANLTPATGGTL